MTKTIINALRICSYRKSLLEMAIYAYSHPDPSWGASLDSPEICNEPSHESLWDWYDNCIGENDIWPEDYD